MKLTNARVMYLYNIQLLCIALICTSLKRNPDLEIRVFTLNWLNYILKDQLFQKSTRAFAVGSADNGFCPVINKPSTSTCERKGALAV